jgi:hypothetical protein
MQTLNFPHFQTLAFAGGGNRCWWQAGLVTHLQDQGAQLPRQLVGTSAGAAIAASLVTGSTMTALQACQRLYAANAQLFDWRGLRQLKFKFAHQTVYPAWLSAFVHEGNFKTLQNAPSQLLVAGGQKTVSQHPPGFATVSGTATSVLCIARLRDSARCTSDFAGRCGSTVLHVRCPPPWPMGLRWGLHRQRPHSCANPGRKVLHAGLVDPPLPRQTRFVQG